MGKTSTAYAPPSPTGKHPHLRGENPYSGTFIPTLWETSPPAWGKLEVRGRNLLAVGNIPTCVGKTLSTTRAISRRWKHPHLRGENRTLTVGSSIASETSPPAWGKLDVAEVRAAYTRNIPTCVGKTYEAMHKVRASGKHPHLRGENLKSDLLRYPVMETSPPAWGKPSQGRRERQWPGNIPTCVGKTARFCLDCHSGYYILLKSKFLALSLRQGRAIFAYHPSLGIDLRLAEAQRDVPNDCGGRVIKGRLLPN